MSAIWYDAAMAHDCVVPFSSMGAGLIERNWEDEAACPFFEGGPGIIIRDYLHPDGVEFDADSPVEDFTEVFGNSIGTLVITPAFRDYDVATACVRIDKPYSTAELVEPYGDDEVDKLAVWLAEHVGGMSAGDEFELGFVWTDFCDGWSFFYAKRLNG